MISKLVTLILECRQHQGKHFTGNIKKSVVNNFSQTVLSQYKLQKSFLISLSYFGLLKFDTQQKFTYNIL